MSADFVTIVNQTGRPKVLNLAPVSDNSVHLPPRGRTNILVEELDAYEIQGGLKASPPTLAVIRPIRREVEKNVASIHIPDHARRKPQRPDVAEQRRKNVEKAKKDKEHPEPPGPPETPPAPAAAPEVKVEAKVEAPPDPPAAEPEVSQPAEAKEPEPMPVVEEAPVVAEAPAEASSDETPTEAETQPTETRKRFGRRRSSSKSSL